MEEKKFDKQSMIGFLLIGAILLFMLWQNQPSDEELAAQKAQEEQMEAQEAAAEKASQTDAVVESTTPQNDSLALERYKATLGSFAYSATLPSATDDVTELENDVLALKVSNKGGFITEARLKNFKSYDSVPVYLIKDGNSRFNLTFSTTDNHTLNSENLYFEPSLSKEGENQVLSMKLKVSDSEYLEYRYTLKPDDYMMGFGIKTVGLQNVVNTSQPINLDWQLKGYRHAKSITYENRYTRLTYEYEEGDHDKLSQTGDDDAIETNVDWFNFRQHFFSSILLTDQPFDEVRFSSKNLVEDEEVDTVYTKQYAANMQLKPVNGELNYAMDFYYGPTDYQILNNYDRNIDEAMPLGWGIFGVINKYLIIPFFNFLIAYFPAGIAIILLTISIKLLLSPVQYKQYLSQGKMKVLRPEINEINEKYADNPMKKQQETMRLYSKAGASPLSGCIPGLLQIPVFYALFTFFPSAFALRHKSFLWADDLSSYDKIADLPFHIPFYGDHVSLFPILASIAIFIYMTMTTGQSMQQAQQPGMPNMKFLMYLSPIMMLFFFNNYASGLSLYYFISNLITIGIMLVIKNFILDEDKIHAKIATAKAKPKKKSKFSQKFSEMMEQAEKQQRNK